MEKLIVSEIGKELEGYVKLFNELKDFYDKIDDENTKALYCINLQLYFGRIKVYDKKKDIFTELTNCDYIKQ